MCELIFQHQVHHALHRPLLSPACHYRHGQPRPPPLRPAGRPLADLLLVQQTHGATVGEFIVKSGAQWHSLQTNRTGNIVTHHNKADYDALFEKPYTGLLAALVDVDFDGLGVPCTWRTSPALTTSRRRRTRRRGLGSTRSPRPRASSRSAVTETERGTVHPFVPN